MITGMLIKRYKRFLADVKLESGDIVTAHCPNSGKLLGMPLSPPVLLTDHGLGGTRKLRYTLEWFQDGQTWVGVNTHDANRLVEQFLRQGLIPECAQYPSIRREVKYGENSRVDFLLENAEQRLYLEVKSVHMNRDGVACFPDCPTERGSKHMRELSSIIDDHTKACVLYLVQRSDCQSFSIAEDLDPQYAAASLMARDAGVMMLAYDMVLDPIAGQSLQKCLPIV